MPVVAIRRAAAGPARSSSAPDDKVIARHDRSLNVEVGVTYNLGKATWNKVPDVDAINALHQSELDALNAKLNDANASFTKYGYPCSFAIASISSLESTTTKGI